MTMNRVFGRNLTVLVALVSGGFVFLGMQLSHNADFFASRRPGVVTVMTVLAWAAVLGNALFVYWLLQRLLGPIRRLVEQAQAAGVAAPPAGDTAVQKRHADAIDAVGDICSRVGQALPAIEARRLFPKIVCQSRAMRNLLAVVQRAATSNTTVLILGESGTGKELVARSIHANGPRADGPFLAVNCAAIPGTLLESELFGHEKGSFTGAEAQRQGLFESARGGTVFLDEIGDMPLDMQAKLLRVLQERVVQRVGGSRPIPVDVRLIAATHRDLRALVAAGKFREDLFFRLSVLPLKLPPLRRRREDIPLLVRTFLRRFSTRPVQVSPAALRFLVAYDWPGNVRELENAMESAVLLADDEIRPEHLPPQVAPDPGGPLPALPESIEEADLLVEARVPEPAAPTPAEDAAAPESPFDTGVSVIVPNVLPAEGFPAEGSTLDAHVDAYERAIVMDALRRTDGVQVEAARLLGIKERSLWHRVKKHNIDVEACRSARAQGSSPDGSAAAP